MWINVNKKIQKAAPLVYTGMRTSTYTCAWACVMFVCVCSVSFVCVYARAAWALPRLLHIQALSEKQDPKANI